MTTGLATVGAVGVGLVAGPMVAAAPIMALTGFGSAGPIAGRFLPSHGCQNNNNKKTFMETDGDKLTNFPRCVSYIGSLAAGAQAVAGNVVAGGTFATIQSAAMGGYGIAAVSSAMQGVGVAMISTAGSALALNKAKL